jgi:chaperonin GroES
LYNSKDILNLGENMKLEPLGTKVVVKVEEAENKTAKGIIIPDASKEKPTIGVIIAVNETTKSDFSVDVGTKILFGKFSGTEVVLEKEKLLIIEMDEAFAIIRD